jgi:hypothetical protein
MGSANFAENDWLNLDAIHFLGTHVVDMFSSEMFRPLTPVLFGVLHELLGLDARGFALFFIAVNIAAAVQLARVFHLLGFSWLAVTMGALSTLISRISIETFAFFTQQQLTLTRLFLVSAILGLLRAGRAGARSWYWLVWAVLALCTHEQSVLMVPLFFLCIVQRDGWDGISAALRRKDVKTFLAVVGVYLVLHVLLLRAEGDHELSLLAIPHKLDVLRSFTNAYLGWDRHLRSSPIGTIPDLSGTILLGAFVYWLVVQRAQALRMVAFSLAWTVVGYSLYVLALRETAGYFFNVSEPGLGLLVGALLDFMVRGSRAPLLLGVAAIFAVGQTPVTANGNPECPPPRDVSPRLMSLIDEAVREVPDGLVRVIFVGDAPVNIDVAPSYLGAIGDDFDWNDRPIRHPADRAHAVAVTYPTRRFRTWVLDEETARYLCVRPGDAAIRVTDRPPAAVQWEFARLPIGCGAAWQELPPQLGAVPTSPSQELRDIAWRYWQAYAAFDDATASRLYEELQSRSTKEPDAAATRIIEAVRATRP